MFLRLLLTATPACARRGLGAEPRGSTPRATVPCVGHRSGGLAITIAAPEDLSSEARSTRTPRRAPGAIFSETSLRAGGRYAELESLERTGFRRSVGDRHRSRGFLELRLGGTVPAAGALLRERGGRVSGRPMSPAQGGYVLLIALGRPANDEALLCPARRASETSTTREHPLVVTDTRPSTAADRRREPSEWRHERSGA